jgi:Phage integrase, N-terminal SAM-like domain
MDGSIRQVRDGVYQVRWEIRLEDGRRKYLSATVKGRKADAERFRRDKVGEVDKGVVVVPTKMTVSAFCEIWLRDHASVNVRARTLEQYEGVIRRELVPAFGKVELQALTAAHVRAWLSDMTRRGLAPGSVIKT